MKILWSSKLEAFSNTFCHKWMAHHHPTYYIFRIFIQFDVSDVPFWMCEEEVARMHKLMCVMWNIVGSWQWHRVNLWWPVKLTFWLFIHFFHHIPSKIAEKNSFWPLFLANHSSLSDCLPPFTANDLCDWDVYLLYYTAETGAEALQVQCWLNVMEST